MPRHLLLILLCWPLLALAQTSPHPAEMDARLRQLYESEWQWRQQQLAVWDEDNDAQAGAAQTRLPDVSPKAQAARLAYLEQLLAQLDQIDVQALSPAEQLNYAVYRPQIEHRIAALRFREYEMPFNSDSAFWSDLDFMARAELRDADAYRAYAARLRDIPRYFEQQIANMRAGLRRGFSVPRAVLTGRDTAIAAVALLDDPQQAVLFAPYQRMPASIPPAQQATLRAEGEAAIRDAVIPAYRRLLAFFREEYLPKARTTLAAEAMPDGKAWYREQIRRYTTLDLSPEQIHAIGLREVAATRAEMEALLDQLGFTGRSPQTRFQDFLAFLRSDPQFYAKTPQQLLERAAWISKRVDGRIGQLIGTLPRGRFTIEPVPAAIAPYWTAGRGGADVYWVNTYDLPSRPLYNLPALTLHESSPGHSLQQQLVREQGALPGFRKDYISAYGEGWALYSEWLGKEMGIYETPYEEFGRLTYAMWRACRLVIDTGIHHFGWSRERAIAYLRDNTALSTHEVETEVDRYISWPGQALSYKLGELVIRDLRHEAETALGPRFDVRAFHDVVLGQGALPLPVLQTQVRAWIAARQADATSAPAP
ncbi:MAG: DUF885 family protein [Thermomonas hydrothermalis]|uniref:DUF885 domain-containing protein n=1 Tax=Thermomonas hydrothermalis TaxID=213588 RepID=UPI002352AAAB|nr:DUF885 family protein [Thermomonas hydrothermalis]MCL6619529.1 DUF885 family protein [Thermomonas hydrothermalis]